MRKLIVAVLMLFILPITANASNVLLNSYSSTNVTTAAYVQIVASTTQGVSKVFICDTSGQIVQIGVGAAGSEVATATTPVSGCAQLSVTIPQGSRVALKSLTASATTGYFALSLLPGF